MGCYIDTVFGGCMKRSIVAFIFLLAHVGAAGAATVKYAVVLMGKSAGYQSVEGVEGAPLKIHFEYNDRGRGPKLDSTILQDADGLPVSVEITGNDYFKGPVQERFQMSDGRATWKNGAEQDEKTLDGKSFYLSLYGSPYDLGLLAKAALKAGGKMPLLPAGEVRIEKLGERKVRSGSQE